MAPVARTATAQAARTATAQADPAAQTEVGRADPDQMRAGCFRRRLFARKGAVWERHLGFLDPTAGSWATAGPVRLSQVEAPLKPDHKRARATAHRCWRGTPVAPGRQASTSLIFGRTAGPRVFPPRVLLLHHLRAARRDSLSRDFRHPALQGLSGRSGSSRVS